MEGIFRDVRNIDAGDRRVLEHIAGAPLRDEQTLVIQILTPTPAEAVPATPGGESSTSNELPDWCNVYEGLSEAEIAEIEKSIVRSHESRSIA